MFQEWLKDYEKLKEENNMGEEDKIIDRVMMIDQWKVAGDMYTQDELNAIGELLDLYNKEKLNTLNLSEQLNKEKEKNKQLKKENQTQRSQLNSAFNNGFIHKDKIKEILGIEEDISSEEVILTLIKTIVDENNRLEDIEDRKVQIEYNNVFNKGVKFVEDKIKEKIKYYKKIDNSVGIMILEKLLEE